MARYWQIWNIKDLGEIARRRQDNEFDMNIIISGARGNGKSTLAFKFLTRNFHDVFNPWKHIVYDRQEVMHLLESQKKGIVFDDESIRTAYKRNFQNADQKVLVQMLNMYRDNFNIYIALAPKFFSLDKDLRDIFKIHLHVIERGVAIIHVAHDDSLYSDDPWDSGYNKKLEEKWAKMRKRNPNYIPPYHRLTTYAGILKYKDITPKQREVYKNIKEEKRKLIYETQLKKEMGLVKDKDEEIFEKTYALLLERKLTEERIDGLSLALGVTTQTLVRKLNDKLQIDGYVENVKDFLSVDPEKKKLIEKLENTGRFGYKIKK